MEKHLEVHLACLHVRHVHVMGESRAQMAFRGTAPLADRTGRCYLKLD